MSKKLPELRRTQRPDQGQSPALPEKTAEKKVAAATRPKVSDKTSATVETRSEPSEAIAEPIATRTTTAIIETNTVAATGPAAEQSGQPGPSKRRQHGKKLIAKYALWSSAFGLLPVPIADVAAISATQVHMVAALSKYYGVPFTKNWIRTLLGAIVGGATPWAATTGLVSLCKGMPGLGVGVGVVGMVGLSNITTRILGHLFIDHFETGGDLSNINTGAMHRNLHAGLKKN